MVALELVTARCAEAGGEGEAVQAYQFIAAVFGNVAGSAAA